MTSISPLPPICWCPVPAETVQALVALPLQLEAAVLAPEGTTAPPGSACAPGTAALVVRQKIIRLA